MFHAGGAIFAAIIVSAQPVNEIRVVANRPLADEAESRNSWYCALAEAAFMTGLERNTANRCRHHLCERRN